MSSAAPRSSAWGRVVVVMPTYNEIDSLERVLRHLLDGVAGVDVLIVDDASPDGTGAAADALAAADARIHVLHRPAKSGLGTAYLDGFAWAAEHAYDVVVEMDADGSHPSETLPTMLDALVDGDPRPGLVIGSRWVPGGSVVNWPRHRLLLSRAANVYARAALRLPVADATGGFRAYPLAVATQIGRHVDSRGYSFQIEMALRVHEAGLPIVEMPIVFSEREAGRSKMSRTIVIEAMARVTGWGLRRVFGRRPRRTPEQQPE
jgi:dolichol-phosphate mannosyltransferase